MMNVGSYINQPSASSPQALQGQGLSSNGGAMNPAMMAAYANSGGGGGSPSGNANKFPYGANGVNPSQLMSGMGMDATSMNMGMNGMGGMGMGGMQMNGRQTTQSGMNPQMMQQAQAGFNGINGAGLGGMGLDGMSGMNTMGGMGNMAMGNMGTINPAAMGGNASLSNSGNNMSALGVVGNMGGMGMGLNQNMGGNAANMGHGMNMSMNMGGNSSNMGMNAMGGGGIPNAGGMMNNASMNPNPSNPSHPQSNVNANTNMNMNPNMGMNNVQANLNMNMAAMLQNMGMSRQQFAALSPQDRQMLQAKVLAATQQQQQQQQQLMHMQRMQQQHQQMSGGAPGTGNSMGGQGQMQQGFPGSMGDGGIHHPRPADPRSSSVGPNAGGQFYDRPSSSASSHNQQGGNGMPQQMRPPPPPRPPTAQGHNQGGIGQQMSRPGTSHSHHSPNSSITAIPQQHGGRPPSRATSVNDFGAMSGGMANGAKPSTPISGGHQSFINGSQPSFSQGSQGHNIMQGSPPPGSPIRKRKATLDSPRMGGEGLPAMMGPPVLPRQQSGSGDAPPMTPQLGHMNVNMGMNGIPMTPRPQSSNAMGGPHHPHQQQQQLLGMRPGGTNMNVQMGGMGGIGGMNPNIPAGMMGGVISGMVDPSTPQRQGSIPPQPSGFPGAQTPRQHSLPPPGTPQKIPADAISSAAVVPGAVGVAGITNIPNSRNSLPPSVPLNGSSSSSSSLSSQIPTIPSQAAIIPQLPPLPANVSLNPAVTRVTVVPLIDSTKVIPPLEEKEIQDVKGWMKVDKEYDGVYRKMKERAGEEMKEMFGPGSLAWWEKGSLMMNSNRFRRGREGFDVRYQRTRRERDARDRKKNARREGLRVPRRLKPEDADRPEELVPIRLEFDVEQHHKMRDTFIWNLNDPVVTPESFAQSIVDDYGLNSTYHVLIVKSIQEQLSDYKAHSTNYDGDEKQIVTSEGAMVLKGQLNEEDVTWWESWRKKVEIESRLGVRKKSLGGKSRKRRKLGVQGQQQQHPSAEALMPSDVGNDEDSKHRGNAQPDAINVDEALVHEDMRILIKLDIIVGSIKLDDQFEWDLDNQDASPEEFADVYARELGLVGEFKTAIAHSIREQVQTYQKSLFLIGHPSDGSLVQDDDLRMSFLPSLTSGARPISEVQSFTPLLNYLSDGEIEKNEKERDKDMSKRRKRATRGRRGIALPDREPIRTYRTPAIGFPELDPATLAAAIAASAPTSRRAAAAAASLTIANMVASENGTAFIPQTIQTAPQPTPVAVKEKKPKGLFKPPTLPDEVLHARAQVTAPTPSTAADVTKLPAPLENDPPLEPIEPPVSTTAPPDSRFSKIISAKRAKELEREAKEKEFADGQHPNYIDGVWHCSNCGCPESIAIGRRKGPLGDKSQCGTCGKFWHRHRRPRPVEYTTSLDFHMGVKKEVEGSKTGAKKKSGAAALRAQSSTLPNTPTDMPSEPQTPLRNDRVDLEASSQLSPVPVADEPERAISPVSTVSSASEPPLSQRVRTNGTHSNTNTTVNANAAPPSTPASSRPTPSQTTPARQHPVPVVEVPPPPNTPKSSWPPQWLTSAMQAMQAKYTNDKFEVILRKVTASTTPEWRIKCLDCPGKLYTPGPGETLSNYEVHLKNRQHRQRVNERVNGSAAS